MKRQILLVLLVVLCFVCSASAINFKVVGHRIFYSYDSDFSQYNSVDVSISFDKSDIEKVVQCASENDGEGPYLLIVKKKTTWKLYYDYLLSTNHARLELVSPKRVVIFEKDKKEVCIPKKD